MKGDVLTGPERRRRWSSEQNADIVGRRWCQARRWAKSRSGTMSAVGLCTRGAAKPDNAAPHRSCRTLCRW